MDHQVLSQKRSQLENLLKADSYHDMLPILKNMQGKKVTIEGLQKSKIGVLVNKLRKQETHKEVAKIATAILVDWKKVLLESEKPAVVEKKQTAHNVKSTPSIQTPPPAGTIASLAGNELFQQYKTGDSVRDKCIEMFVTALCTDTPEMFESPDELVLGTAAAVEKALFAEFSGTDAKYKAKFRSKYLNLKDKLNPHLRNTLLRGECTSSSFIAMTAAEMASEERKAGDLALQEVNLKNTKAAQDNSAETDQFKCGRCKQRKCKYYQLQTRSADEPMTTFVTCINCNNRWKFC